VSKKFNLAIEKDSDGLYVANLLSLPGCQAQGQSIDELLEGIKEAIHLYLEEEEREEFESQFLDFEIES